METATKVKKMVRFEQEEFAVKEKPTMEEKPVDVEELRQEIEPQEEIPQNEGLCATCNEEPNCFYARNADRPVLFCEMFDNTSPVSEKEPQGERSKAQQGETEQIQSATLKGLCVNCENRETCTFPKPEEGVWHCEEYL